MENRFTKALQEATASGFTAGLEAAKAQQPDTVAMSGVTDGLLQLSRTILTADKQVEIVSKLSDIATAFEKRTDEAVLRELVAVLKKSAEVFERIGSVLDKVEKEQGDRDVS